jgi:phosphoribosylformylglycinamidine synthase
MTECIYTTPLDSFENGMIPTPVRTIPVLEFGRKALEELNNERQSSFYLLLLTLV